MGLMMLWMMLVDEWLVFEGVAIVVEVLLDCLVHMIFVLSGELLLERSLVKGKFMGVTSEI